MLKRTLFFGSPGKLSIHDSLLMWESTVNPSRTIPLEDIAFIVLESQQILISTYCLNAIAENGIALICCDSAHLPSAQMIPYSNNSLTQKHTEAQLNFTAPAKGRLWKQIIQAKITNQAQCLAMLGLPDKRLLTLCKEVKNHDESNAEAVAARYYFQQLSAKQDKFLRQREGMPPNHALNYGYAIIRAAVARALTGSGLLCVVGVHHANQYNPMGLADDIMEPYRPFIDALVFSNLSFFDSDDLNKEQKAELLRALTMDVKVAKENRPLLNAISFTTASLARCFLKEQNEIVFPEFSTHDNTI